MKKDKSKKNTIEQPVSEGVKRPIESEGNVQLVLIPSESTANRTKNYQYLKLALTSLFQHLKKYKTYLRNLGLITIAGIGLSVLALCLDHHYSKQSSIGQEDIKKNQEVLRKDLGEVPNATVKRIAELVGLKEVIKNGPIKDLVELARDSDAVKRAAEAKVNSGNRTLEIEGAKELETIAKKRVSALKKLNVKAAEDFRQAGAAFLVAQNLTKAVSVYKESTLLDPNYLTGYITLSELALRLGDFDLAEKAAKTALFKAEVKGTENWWERRFTLNQLTIVYINQNNIENATKTVKKLELLTRDKLEESSIERNTYGSLTKYGLTRITTTGAKNNITVYYDGDILSSYLAVTDDDGNLVSSEEEGFGSVLAADMSYLVSQKQHMETLVWKGKTLELQNDIIGAIEAYEEGLILARKHLKEVQFHGIEVRSAEFLELLGALHEKQGNFKKALRMYDECLKVHTKLVEMANDEGYKKFVATFNRDYIPNYQRNIAMTLKKVSRIKYSMGNRTGAFDAVQERVGILRSVISKDEKGADFIDLAKALRERAAYHFINNELEQSLRDLQEARSLIKPLLGSDEYGQTAKRIDEAIISGTFLEGFCIKKYEKFLYQQIEKINLRVESQ